MSKKYPLIQLSWLDECLICSMIPDLVPEVGISGMHEEEKNNGGREKRWEWKEWEAMRWPRLVSMLGVTKSETSLLGLRTKILPIQCLFRCRTLIGGWKIFKHISYADTMNLCLKLIKFWRVCVINLNRCKVSVKESNVRHGIKIKIVSEMVPGKSLKSAALGHVLSSASGLN